MELEAEGVPVSVTLIHPGRIDTPYNEHARSYMEKQPAPRAIGKTTHSIGLAMVCTRGERTRDGFALAVYM